MIKADSTVIKETKYIAYFCMVLSVIMQAVFLALGRWNYTVLLGNILSLAAAVANFWFMGISVQKALEREPADAKKLMKASQTIRNFGMFVAVVFGVVLPYFNTVSVILPIFFPRIAVSARPLMKEKKEVTDK